MNINWIFVKDSSIDVNDKFGIFLEIFTEDLHACFPERIITNRGMAASWYSAELGLMRKHLFLLRDQHNGGFVDRAKVTLLKKIIDRN